MSGDPMLRFGQPAWRHLALLGALALALCAGWPPPGALAQGTFGKVVVEQGTLTLVRNGEKFTYKAGAPAVVVEQDDLLVAHGGSQAVLESVDGARVTIGANAAFQVKPFKQRERFGMLRFLFGRFRTKLIELTQGGQFSVKTAQAVIGVKGTEFVTSVTAQGDTLVVVEETEHAVALTGLDGPDRELAPQVMAVVINSKPVSEAALVTPEVRRELALEDLASPVAYRPEAKALKGEEVLVRVGIVSEADLVESKRDQATLQDAVPFDEQAPRLNQRYDLPPGGEGGLLEFNVILRPVQ